MGCVVDSGCDDCTLPDSFCDQSESECAADGCITTADCGYEVCVLGEFSRGFGRCTSSRSACEPDEFQFFMEEDTCVIYQSCWTDPDCPEGYVCTSLERLGMPFYGAEEASMCTRQVR